MKNKASPICCLGLLTLMIGLLAFGNASVTEINSFSSKEMFSFQQQKPILLLGKDRRPAAVSPRRTKIVIERIDADSL